MLNDYYNIVEVYGCEIYHNGFNYANTVRIILSKSENGYRELLEKIESKHKRNQSSRYPLITVCCEKWFCLV